MLTTRSAVNRRARYTARLADQSRPHGRRRGYDHHIHDPRQHRSQRGPTVVAAAIFAGVLLFLLLVVLGALQPATGPLTKFEPVSTTQLRK
jgi:hypothetical protein